MCSMRLRIASRTAGFGAILGAAGFACIVALLHFMQSGYDFRRQLISELADGVGGSAMFSAFLMLGTSVLCVERGLQPPANTHSVRAALVLSCIGFVGAGIWTLRAATLIHVFAVAFAFVTLVLAMVILPGRPGRDSPYISRRISWMLAAGAAVSVASADTLISLGIAQRITAFCALAWLTLVGAGVIRTAQDELTS